jgi:hypothetical protein
VSAECSLIMYHDRKPQECFPFGPSVCRRLCCAAFVCVCFLFFESCEAGGSFMYQGRASLTSAWLLTASLGCYRDWFACVVLQHSRIVIVQALLLQLQPLDSFIEAVLLRLPPQTWG